MIGERARDPASPRPASFGLPEPRLTPVYRLEAAVGEPVDLGNTGHGRRRIVPLTGGIFSGPSLNGKLLPGASADWQTVLPDGTALGDIRYTLQTDDGEVLYVQSRGGRHGSADILARRRDASEMDAAVKGSAEKVVVGWSWWGLLGSGGWCDGNDDCHSEIRGSEPQDSVRS